jgi:hypothetical protein
MPGCCRTSWTLSRGRIEPALLRREEERRIGSIEDGKGLKAVAQITYHDSGEGLESAARRVTCTAELAITEDVTGHRQTTDN